MIPLNNSPSIPEIQLVQVKRIISEQHKQGIFSNLLRSDSLFDIVNVWLSIYRLELLGQPLLRDAYVRFFLTYKSHNSAHASHFRLEWQDLNRLYSDEHVHLQKQHNLPYS